MPDPTPEQPLVDRPLRRRRFLTFLVAAPVLTVGGSWVFDDETADALPGPTVPDVFDLGDALVLASVPTMPLLTLAITPDNHAEFALPRMEVGQGMITAVSMMIAEELGFPVENVRVTLADARPELLFNQLTGGSYNTRALYQPVSRLAAGARERTRAAAARQWNLAMDTITVGDGLVRSSDGRTATFGSLSQLAASLTQPLSPNPRRVSQQTVLGRRRAAVDARDIVTGRKRYTLDLEIPGAIPTVVLHAPQIKGTLRSFDNRPQIRAMPGVVDAVTIRAVPDDLIGGPPTAIAILAETFGQALAAQDAVRATWNPGTLDGRSDTDFRSALRAATLPTLVPRLGALSVDGEFEFAHVGHAPMETMCAVADVSATRAEVWSGLKSPIPAQQEIAAALGLPLGAVTVHVVPSGGSFGRRLFHEAATEAALVSRATGRKVKLMWSRAQDVKHDRLRPATFHRIRATHLLGQVLAFEHRFTSGSTDFSHGLGDALTSVLLQNPVGNRALAQSVFTLMMPAPYNLGVTTQLLNEVDFDMNTGSWRSVYTGTGRTAEEIMMDRIAAALRRDPVAFRLAVLTEEKARACLRWVRDHGQWGRPMPPGTAQGVAVNAEHRSAVACLVEIDTRPPFAEPRVTKAVMAFDAGIPMNPSGLEQQMLGGLNDGISTILRASVHIDDGAVRESSFSDFRYARQADYPSTVLLHVFPGRDGNEPGGAGETSVAAAAGAVANAYARARGVQPRGFPINH